MQESTQAGKRGGRVLRRATPRLTPESKPLSAITSLGPVVRGIISALPQSQASGSLLRLSS